jgi:hypothetical protein
MAMETVLATARRGHPGLFWTALAMAALSAGIVLLAVFDQRELLGAPLWFKPLKFTISFTVYLMALAWFIGLLPQPALRRTGWALVALSVIEMVIIGGQAARGVRSHFNDDGGLGSLLFSIMGAAAVGLLLFTAVIGIRFLRERSDAPDMSTAIRLGLGVSVVGMLTGIVMSINGGHAVGVLDGGPGLPLVGWSTTGGDLRVSHFVGLHALQLLPLFAAVLARWAPGLDAVARTGVIRVVAAGFLGLTVLLAWQALRAQPLLAPDLATVAVFGALAIGTGLGIRAVVQRSARSVGQVPAGVAS